MIVRDLDVLQAGAARADVSVTFSVPTLDQKIWRYTEPHTSPPIQRLRALRTLIDGGIRAGVGVAPILPGLSDNPELLADVVRAARDHGATHVWANVLYLRPGTREHFMDKLAAIWPELVPTYETALRGPGVSAEVGGGAAARRSPGAWAIDLTSRIAASCGWPRRPIRRHSNNWRWSSPRTRRRSRRGLRRRPPNHRYVVRRVAPRVAICLDWASNGLVKPQREGSRDEPRPINSPCHFKRRRSSSSSVGRRIDCFGGLAASHGQEHPTRGAQLQSDGADRGRLACCTSQRLDGSHGREPWVSDGSSLGTHMVKNISPGSYGSMPRDFTALGGQVYFTAADGSTGRELWVTDGTSVGTHQVQDIRPGRKSANPTDLTPVGSTLFFTANDGGTTGPQLWKSDGTADGTVQIAGFGDCGGGLSDLTSFAGKLFFVRHTAYCTPGPQPHYFCCQLWQSDGTDAGTKPFEDRDGGYIHDPSDLVLSGPYLYFAAANQYPNEDWALWRTAGDSSTTRPIKRVLSAQSLTDVDGTLFFTDWTTEHRGLWKSNGTKAGTVFVSEQVGPRQLTEVAGYVYFTTLDPTAGRH